MSILLRKRPGKLLIISSLLLTLIISVFFAEIFLIHDEQIRLVATDITFPIISFLVSGLLFGAALQSISHSGRLAMAWFILAMAQLATATGDLAWSILEIGMGVSPFPSIADAFYLAYYPLFFAGILLMPGKSYSFREWIKKGLDIGIIVISSILVFWNFLIGPIAAIATEDPFLSQVLSMAYPTGDLLLLWGLLAILYNRSNLQINKPVLLLGISTVVVIGTDCIFSYQSLLDIYVSGGLLDLGWIIGYLLTGIAALGQILSTPSVQRQVSAAKTEGNDLFDRAAIHMPYLWLIGAYTLLMYSHITTLPMPFFTIAIAVGVIIVLVLIRQITTLSENRRLLAKHLQMMQQVQAQADELEKTNQMLREEILVREEVELRLSHDAFHDDLTNLPNRALFLDRLGQAIEYTRRQSMHLFSVLFIDLDQFKTVNDSLGHSIGDQMLIMIGDRVQGCLRASDTVARLGGDDFVVLLEDPGNDDGSLHVAKRIQTALSEPFTICGHEVFTTVSIGVVLDLSEYGNAEEALRDAGIAMYRAKTLGKARIEIFNPALRDQAVTRHLLENELRHAINHIEFELYYQPIYSLKTDRITGFEALIRWNHPTRGLLLPGEFMLVTEETGLILPIGKWVLYQACSQISKWRQLFPNFAHLTINVNISSRQFQQPDFVEQIEMILQQTKLEPSTLKLEITESMVIENPSAANQYFDQLRKLGIDLQVDDFGTGYSSLSYLQNFPIQAIKIDRSFVRELGKPGKNSDLVRTMVMMAQDLGMSAIAEGIETEQQREELKRLMCQFGQGYLMAKPMNEAAIVKLLQKGGIEDTVIPLLIGGV